MSILNHKYIQTVLRKLISSVPRRVFIFILITILVILYSFRNTCWD
ncbi:hypothetical protein E2C01_014491 [Portunus trituberculatus]|uniref:Uncharacterized protein n=1 Tax=Portunus trituberculatus TaxID=210409 RepID=A0A5B7DIZ6_PORTR|nr:hypothetical protein [Portunus trituberculatus]